MAWTIDYTETAKKQLRKLDKQTARRIVDFMDQRIAGQQDPRSSGKALTGRMLAPIGVREYIRLASGDRRDHRLANSKCTGGRCSKPMAEQAHGCPQGGTGGA